MVNAAVFFNASAQQVSAQKVEVARLIQEGDTIQVNMGFNIETSAEADGWYVPLPVGQVFDFEEIESYVIQPQAVQHFEISSKVKKINAGDNYVANIGFLIETSAETSGFLFEQEDSSATFFAEAHYQAVFGDQQVVQEQLIVAVNDKITKAVVLENEVTFEFMAGTYTAPAGYVLYANEEDEDGYTVVSPIQFFRDFVILK
jgi:hypothetical protein